MIFSLLIIFFFCVFVCPILERKCLVVRSMCGGNLTQAAEPYPT